MTHLSEEVLPETPQNLLLQMTARRNVAPKRLIEPGPTEEQLNLIFRAASNAPDHGRLQPWRFILIPNSKRSDLGNAFVKALKQRDPGTGQDQIDAAYEKAFRAPCLMIAVISSLPSEPHVPLSERLISLGCSIQNMLLMAETLSIGSGITSGQAMNSKPIRDLFFFTEHEEGICFINFGTVSSRKPSRPRASPSTFVSTL
jgi:nitroreductase